MLNLLDSNYTLLSVAAACGLYSLYRKYSRISISDVPGPESETFLLGHSKELLLTDCGVTEANFCQRYGDVVRVKAALGEDILWIADHKAIKHILHKSGYDYPKPPGDKPLRAMVTDQGLAWADGEMHRRYKKILLPAFGIPEAKEFLPTFTHVVTRLADRWTNELAEKETAGIINVADGLMRVTLDAIGFAAFDHDFGAVTESDDPLMKSYTHLMTVFAAPSPGRLIFRGISRFVPPSWLTFLYEHASSPDIQRLRDNREQVHTFAARLIDFKRKAIEQGKGQKDIMSLLLKANDSANDDAKLRDDEIIPQMRTIMFAAHETTAITIAWGLYELAKHPEAQARVREEIITTRRKIKERGETEFTTNDFDAMPYMVAVMKEILRLHPVVADIPRYSAKDDVLPLANPITSRSGKLIHELPIPKGLRLTLSFYAYQTNEDLWGKDALEFNPSRWLEDREKSGALVGVYANLLSFSAGVKNCIGWRFALVQIQASLIHLVSTFNFALPDEPQDIRMFRTVTVVPKVAGRENEGIQLPLKVSLL